MFPPEVVGFTMKLRKHGVGDFGWYLLVWMFAQLHWCTQIHGHAKRRQFAEVPSLHHGSSGNYEKQSNRPSMIHTQVPHPAPFRTRVREDANAVYPHVRRRCQPLHFTSRHHRTFVVVLQAVEEVEGRSTAPIASTVLQEVEGR